MGATEVGRNDGAGGGCKGGTEDDAARTDGLGGERAREAQVSLGLADEGGGCRWRPPSRCQCCHAGVGCTSSMLPPLEGEDRGMGMLPAGAGVGTCPYDRE